jgi:hypothetical protein
VLVLGSYSDAGENRLQAISEAVRELGYDPLLVRDVEDYPGHSLSQKVAALGGISRFVIVDDTDASGHLAELSLCKSGGWITIVLRFGRAGSYMSAGVSLDSNVILERAVDRDTLDESLRQSVEWAVLRLKEMRKDLQAIYPWRNSSS